jgi:5'(3')-deoxyribonucleotidase
MAKRKLRVGIDVDGVLRDFDSKAMEIIKELYPDKVLSDITHGWDFPNVDVDVKE